jgi:hypothetical protein
MSEHTGKEMGLIKHLSTRNRQLSWKEQANIKARVTAIQMFCKIDIQLAVDYILEVGGFFAQKKAMTEVKEYTNKKGKVSLHHFNPNDNFVGSVHKLGPEPIECEYNALISTDWWNGKGFDIAKCDGISVPRKVKKAIKRK